MSTYEPGTVAAATVRGVPNVTVFRVPGPRWVDPECFHNHDDDVTDVRPLVVLDPEDREQMDRLTKALVEAAYVHGNKRVAHNGIHPDTVADALRSLTKPPKPAEPTGLGAVVEDAEGRRWVLAGRDLPTTSPDNWRAYDGPVVGDWKAYERIDAVRVLSEGVQP